jgi:hypothetical protein
METSSSSDTPSDTPYNIVITLTVSKPDTQNDFTSKVYLHPIQVSNTDPNNIESATEINSSTKEKDISKIISEGLKEHPDVLNKFNAAYNLSRSWKQFLTGKSKTYELDLKKNAITKLNEKIVLINNINNDQDNKVKFSSKFKKVLDDLFEYIKSDGRVNVDNKGFLKINDASTFFNYANDIKNTKGYLSLLPGNLDRINFVNNSFADWQGDESGSKVYFPGWDSNQQKFARITLSGIKRGYFTTETEFLEAMLKTRTNKGGSRRKRRVNSKLTRRQNK